MKLGVALPLAGDWATPENQITVAQRAEALGYHSLWVFQRLFYALAPQNDYPPMPGQPWPAGFRRVSDPIVTLAYVAGATTKIRLGTSVLITAYYTPIMLAKQLATLDRVSRGRLDVGLGIGWSRDEYEASGVSYARRGRRGDEFIRCLRAIWENETSEIEGEFYRLPKSIVEPKPVQKPPPRAQKPRPRRSPSAATVQRSSSGRSRSATDSTAAMSRSPRSLRWWARSRTLPGRSAATPSHCTSSAAVPTWFTTHRKAKNGARCGARSPRSARISSATPRRVSPSCSSSPTSSPVAPSSTAFSPSWSSSRPGGDRKGKGVLRRAPPGRQRPPGGRRGRRAPPRTPRPPPSVREPPTPPPPGRP